MNGKGSNPRKFTKKGHHAVLKNWDEPYPKRKVGRPGSTTYVWRDGKLVDKNTLSDGFEILPIPPVPSEYQKHVNWLQDRMRERYMP